MSTNSSLPMPSSFTPPSHTSSKMLEPITSPPDQVTSFPLAAQIPLKDFTLPDFPAQAAHLRELTLTADIKMDEYQELLKSPNPATNSQHDNASKEIPGLSTLPQSLTHLTLELFSLGFPGQKQFLTSLARALPNLKSLTMFSCLIDGLDESSRADAVGFFDSLPLLREVHFIDSFARPGFFTRIADLFEERAKTVGVEDALKIVEVSYTYRGHEDGGFLGRVGGEELAGLVVAGLVGGSFGFVAEAEGSGELKENGDEGVVEGILPFASDSRASMSVKRRFEGSSTREELKGMRVLNLNMWTFRAGEVGEILYACAGGGNAGLLDLTVSVLMEEGWWEDLLKGCEYQGVAKALEGIEIIGVPARGKVEGEDWKSGSDLVQKKEAVEMLGHACPSLARFEMSILKARAGGTVTWLRKAGDWTMH